MRLDGLMKHFPARRDWGAVLKHPFKRDRVTIIHGLSATVDSGEFFGILGPNGAGKTTVFKMLSASTIPDAGTASVHGLDVVTDARAVRQMIGCVMANDRSLYWRLSAVENLKLFAALHRLPTREATRRIDEVLDIVDLNESRSKMVATFSSGMKQRLLIARALLPKPRVLLLDEPTRSLDPVSARNFRRFLQQELSARLGCTVILATHSSEEALELCDRVAVLDKGELLAIGTPDELSQRFGDQTFSLWSRRVNDAALNALVATGVVLRFSVTPADEDGWLAVRLTVPGGLDRASEALEFLAGAGMGLSRFERVNLTLADLIERVVASRMEGAT